MVEKVAEERRARERIIFTRMEPITPVLVWGDRATVLRELDRLLELDPARDPALVIECMACKHSTRYERDVIPDRSTPCPWCWMPLIEYRDPAPVRGPLS